MWLYRYKRCKQWKIQLGYTSVGGVNNGTSRLYRKIANIKNNQIGQIQEVRNNGTTSQAFHLYYKRNAKFIKIIFTSVSEEMKLSQHLITQPSHYLWSRGWMQLTTRMLHYISQKQLSSQRRITINKHCCHQPTVLTLSRCQQASQQYSLILITQFLPV